MATDNRELGRFILDGIPPAPRGVPQIEVTFDIDANGILGVSAKDKATAKEQSIRIEGSGGLQKDEIDRLVRDAESHAKEDRERRDLIEKRNQLDSMIYGAEKTIAENKDKLAEDVRKPAEDALAEAKKELDGNDAARIDAARQRVEQEMHKVAEILYKSQEGGPAPGGTPGAGAEPASGGDEDVIDAEYTEEKGDG
jgi:molecular chaperone DnaK